MEFAIVRNNIYKLSVTESTAWGIRAFQKTTLLP